MEIGENSMGFFDGFFLAETQCFDGFYHGFCVFFGRNGLVLFWEVNCCENWSDRSDDQSMYWKVGSAHSATGGQPVFQYKVVKLMMIMNPTCQWYLVAYQLGNKYMLDQNLDWGLASDPPKVCFPTEIIGVMSKTGQLQQPEVSRHLQPWVHAK